MVKIAIIDDGISIEQRPGHPRSISGGMSFHSGGGHHFPSSNGHGTKMADCVLQVFPKAKLYIARLDTYQSSNGPTLTAKSATEVRSPL